MNLNELLLKCDSELFSKIAQASISKLSGKAEIIPDSPISLDEYKFLLQATEHAIEFILKHSLSSAQVPSDEWAEVDTKFFEIIHKQLEANAEDKRRIKIKLIIGKNSARLQNYDWDVKWVLGSSSLFSLEEPLTTLQLNLSDGSTHSIEMNQKEISHLIEALVQL